MEAEVLKQFSQELASLYDSKPPVSKAKMVQLTKVALKGLKYYKHVVMAVEKFIHRCKPEYKLPGLYVIDSIVRQSKHQFGLDKDVFAPRFCKNLALTFQAASMCTEEDRPKIVRILTLWSQNNVFPDEILRPILDNLSNSTGPAKNSKSDLENVPEIPVKPINIEKTKRGSISSPLNSSKEMDRKEAKISADTPPTSKTGPPAVTPSSNPTNLNIDQSFLQQIQKLTTTLISQQQKSADSERKLTKKILAEYEYSDDDSADGSSEKGNSEDERGDMTANLAAAAQNLLNNPQLLEQIQKMQQSMRSTPGAPITQGQPQPVPAVTTTGSNRTSVSAGPVESAEPVPAPIPVPLPTQIEPQKPPPPIPVMGPAPTSLPTAVPAPPTQIMTPFSPHFPVNFSVPPPNFVQEPHPQIPVARNFDNQALNYPPPAEPLPPGFETTDSHSISHHREDRDERLLRMVEESPPRKRRSRDRDRSRSGSRSRDKKRKRHRSRSRSHSRRRHKHSSRSTSKDRREKEREKERDKEKERERRSKGLLPVKSRYVSIYSRTLWFGRVPASCEPEELKEALKSCGEPVSIDLIPPRGCAYVVMPDRKSAHKVLDRLKDLKIQNRTLKMAWAPGKGVKDGLFDEGWDMENGLTNISWDQMPEDLTPFTDGGVLDVESLPEHLQSLYNERGRIGAQEAALDTSVVSLDSSVGSGGPGGGQQPMGAEQGQVASQAGQSEPAGGPGQPVPVQAPLMPPVMYPQYQMPSGPGMYPPPFVVPPPGGPMMQRMMPPHSAPGGSGPPMQPNMNGPPHGMELGQSHQGMSRMPPPPNFMTPPPHRYMGGPRHHRFPPRKFSRFNNNDSHRNSTY